MPLFFVFILQSIAKVDSKKWRFLLNCLNKRFCFVYMLLFREKTGNSKQIYNFGT